MSANGAGHARKAFDLQLANRGTIRRRSIGENPMERAFSPYNLRVAVNLGRWPRLVWGAPLALDGWVRLGCACQPGYGSSAGKFR
jgi:hypothetical protein